MTRLKQIMIKFKIPRYKAHRELIRYKQDLKTWESGSIVKG